MGLDRRRQPSASTCSSATAQLGRSSRPSKPLLVLNESKGVISVIAPTVGENEHPFARVNVADPADHLPKLFDDTFMVVLCRSADAEVPEQVSKHRRGLGQPRLRPSPLRVHQRAQCDGGPPEAKSERVKPCARAAPHTVQCSRPAAVLVLALVAWFLAVRDRTGQALRRTLGTRRDRAPPALSLAWPSPQKATLRSPADHRATGVATHPFIHSGRRRCGVPVPCPAGAKPGPEHHSSAR